MSAVVHRRRRLPILGPPSQACLPHVPTLRLTEGCWPGCLCDAGDAHPTAQPPLVIFGNALSKLRSELRFRRQRPTIVCFSSTGDLFQPLPELQAMAYEALETLFHHQVGVVIATKGLIPGPHLDLLQKHANRARVVCELITLDDNILQAFEPQAPPTAARLAQMQALTAAGIATQLRIDPILPGLTDDDATLGPLLAAAAAAGVRRAAASVLALGAGAVRRLRRCAASSPLVRRVLEAFAPRAARTRLALPPAASGAGPEMHVMALAAQTRRAIYGRAYAAAAACRITLHVCGCKNPDLSADTCHLTVGLPQRQADPRQLSLFEGQGVGSW